MKKAYRLLQTGLLAVIMMGLVSSAAMPMSRVEAKLQPILEQIAAESPDEMVRVIVQKADVSSTAESLVEALGGQIIKELQLINAFAAELPAKAITTLQKNDSVNWVSLDAPVVSTGKPVKDQTYTVRDEFNTPSYANNDGLADWKTGWIENDAGSTSDPSAGNYYSTDGYYATVATESYDPPISGNVQIVNGEIRLHDQPDTGTQPSIEREANLLSASDVIFSFSFHVGPGTEAYEDIVVLDISSDGGASFSALSTFDNLNGGTSGTFYTNISDYASAQTRIRFRVTAAFGSPDEYFAVDNIQIEYQSSGLTPNTYLDTLNVRDVWEMGFTGSGIGIAVIDSGISPSRDFTDLRRSISFNSNSATVQDVYGHGTHVAGIIAGNGTDSYGNYMGIAPDADLISLKVSDESGMAYESDTVEALQWVFENKAAYNIRVVNLSIQSTAMMSYHDSPLDAAVEILWHNGIVVVAAAGNYFSGYDFNPILAAPANDPFIITVGASNEKGTSRLQDDSVSPYSAFGTTQDGYYKPEIYAPGKDIISVLSKQSQWDDQHPERAVLGSKYFRMSGTSMSAPMVTGAAALLLQSEPNLTPNQVKYRLMNASASLQWLPYLDVHKALTTPTTESANEGVIPHMLLAKMALIAYWSNTECGDTCDWENIDWGAVNWNSVNWNSVNWNSVNWNSVNWNSVNWNSVNWNSVNWNSVNWNSVNWNSVNWNSVNWNSVNWNSVNWNSVNWND